MNDLGGALRSHGEGAGVNSIGHPRASKGTASWETQCYLDIQRNFDVWSPRTVGCHRLPPKTSRGSAWRTLGTQDGPTIVSVRVNPRSACAKKAEQE